jgi:hypothetical protein
LFPLTRVGGWNFQNMEELAAFSHFELMWMETYPCGPIAMDWLAYPSKLSPNKVLSQITGKAAPGSTISALGNLKKRTVDTGCCNLYWSVSTRGSAAPSTRISYFQRSENSALINARSCLNFGWILFYSALFKLWPKLYSVLTLFS